MKQIRKLLNFSAILRKFKKMALKSHLIKLISTFMNLYTKK